MTNHDILYIRYVGSVLAVLWGLCSCGSDKPDNLEPHLAALAATDITRTGATLNGSASVAGTTPMPELRFRYGTTEDMPQMAQALGGDGPLVHASIGSLAPGTTYYYMLEGDGGRTMVRSNVLALTTLPNGCPSVGNAAIVSRGPMSVIVAYDITDDGGENITETGCLYALAASTDTCRVKNVAYRGVGRQTLLLDRLGRNSSYVILPYARSRAGESVGDSISFTTTDAVSLGEAGQLRSLMGEGLYAYASIAVAGPLNGDDLCCLRAMMGRDAEGDTPGRLSDVDLTDARIVEGGEPYDASRYAKTDVVGQGLFADCAQLRCVRLPNGTIAVEKDAFARCTSLQSVDIPASASSVLPSAGCVSLISVSVSEANASYKSIDGVLLSADATKIVWFPMGKTGAYTLPPTITSIGSYAFKECSIESFSLPDGVTEMGTGAFQNSRIKEAKLSANLRLVPTATFQGCSSLHTVRLGSKTEFVSDYAFSQCPLTDIYVDAPLPPVCTLLSFAGIGQDVFANCRVHVPKGKSSAYEASDGWRQFKNIITD